MKENNAIMLNHKGLIKIMYEMEFNSYLRIGSSPAPQHKAVLVEEENEDIHKLK